MIPYRTIAISLALLGLFPLWTLKAQGTDVRSISTERPSVGTSPDILRPRTVQMETGVNLAYGASHYAADLPESLLRIGIGFRTEVRFTSPNLMRDSNAIAGSTPMQAQDLAFSAKAGLKQAGSILPQSIVLGLSCPSGSLDQTTGSYDPAFILIWQQASHKGFTFSENVGAQHTSVDGVRMTRWLPSIAVQRSLTPKLGWFAEYAPTFAMDTAALQIVDVGLTYTATANSQLDVRVGYQNDTAGLRNLLSVGYSFRIEPANRQVR